MTDVKLTDVYSVELTLDQIGVLKLFTHYGIQDMIYLRGADSHLVKIIEGEFLNIRRALSNAETKTE